MRKLLAAVVSVAALFAVVAGGASAGGGNPSGTGQPSQSCQAEPTGPPGITSTTNGFATKAVNVYAGTQPQNSNNPHSVSQYDVACYQVSIHH
ncbi:MAG TPA: hypothetical protein VFJ11_07620 [Gaiellaceae bacterium]|nr:hypothetical protein [Gaiellaceae bacterium]